MSQEALDLTGLECPMPVLKLKKALKDVAEGGVLRVVTDDPHAVEDFRVFAEQSGHSLEAQEPVEGGRVLHTVRKKTS